MREKAVIIMYPDCRTTGGCRLGDRTRDVITLTADFYETVTKIMEGYRRLHFSLLGITYKDTTRDKFSPLYPYQLFDELIPVEVTFNDWPTKNHRPRHEQLLNDSLSDLNLQPHSLAVVGGYHADDCVQTMTNVLNNNSHFAKINPLLTDRLGPILVARRVNKLRPTILIEDD